jgi:hypothetical protein
MKHLFLFCVLFCLAGTTHLQAQTKKKKTTTKKVEKKKTTTTQSQSAPRQAVPTPQQSAPSETPRKSSSRNDGNDRLGLNLGNGSAIKQGTTVLDLGVGFNYYGIPIHASAEKLVANNISVGLFGNYMSYNEVAFISSSYSYHLIYAGVKGNYYFNELLGYVSNKYHLYAGLNIGYIKLITTDNSFSGFNSRPFLGGQVGVRYFFKKKIGVYAEGDWSGQGGGTIGVSIKLK